MEILSYFFVFIFGLIMGSFLNCFIYRFEKGESFLKGRSFCPKCKHPLNWQDLIPIFSFLILRGKCRYCQEKISIQYPLVELFTAILFVLILNYELGIGNHELLFANIFTFLFLILISCFLIIIFVYDLKHYIIPDKIIYPAIGLALLYQLFGIWDFGNWNFSSPPNFWLKVGFGILPAFFLLAIILISKGKWMGLGDFKLAFFMGLFLGFPKILAALFSAFLIGAIIGIGLVITGKKNLKSELPFAPFLVLGTFLAIFFGENIINFYLNLFSL